MPNHGPPLPLGNHGSPVPLPRALLPHLVPGICAQTSLAPRECGRLQASQEGWLVSSCLLLLSLENFIPMSTTPRAPRGLWATVLAHAWAWMCFFHLGLARRVQSQRLAEWWQYVPEVTLVASRRLAAQLEERGNSKLCVGDDSRWAEAPLARHSIWPVLLTVALQRPRWGTPTHHRSGG